MTTRTAVLLDAYRRLQAEALAGNTVLKPAAFIGFGDGGHNADNTPKPIDSSREGLFHEVVVKELSALIQPTMYMTRARAIAQGQELPVVSEAMLYDEDMRPIAMAVFPPKYTAEGETYEVTLQVHF